MAGGRGLNGTGAAFRAATGCAWGWFVFRLLCEAFSRMQALLEPPKYPKYWTIYLLFWAKGDCFGYVGGPGVACEWETAKPPGARNQSSAAGK